MALLVDNGQSWPNTLHVLGYRFHHFAAGIRLLAPGGGLIKKFAPDAVAYHDGKRLALVIECKTGTNVGLHQVPEGRSESQDQWAEALTLPRHALLAPPRTQGLLVSEFAALEPKLPEVEQKGLTWLRVGYPFQLEPDLLEDDRLAGQFSSLPKSPWPRSYVPYSGDTTGPGGLERVIASIGPLLLEDAAKGRDWIRAEDLARRTHDAVWRVSDKEQQTAWANAADRALANLASGAMKDLATHDAALRRLRLNGVRPNVRATAHTLRLLRKAVDAGHRKAQRPGSRVAASRSNALQTELFGEDEF